MAAEIDQTQASIVGLMFLFPELIQTAVDTAPEDWFTGDYRKAFSYISEHPGSDAVALSSSVGIPTTEIMSWLDAEFLSSAMPMHLANLKTQATARKIKYLAQQLMRVESEDEARSLIDRFDRSFSANEKTVPTGMRENLQAFIGNLERRYRLNGALSGMSYGIDGLDEVTEGLHAGDLVIVAGPPSMGKTAFAQGCAEAVVKQGKRGLIFSCEMTKEQLLMRSAAAESGVYLSTIRSAKLRDHDWGRLQRAAERMAEWQLLIDDPAGISVAEVGRKVAMAKKDGLDFVMIDYLQIMKYDKSREVQELDVITVALKNIAKEHSVCVMALSQLNRGSEKDKRKPTMSDLRGSGQIEANADVILFPYREAANCEKCREKVEDATHSTKAHQLKAEIIIGKQRQGERNISVPAMWVGDKTRFVDVETGRDGAPYWS